jgi:hypothetical protein
VLRRLRETVKDDAWFKLAKDADGGIVERVAILFSECIGDLSRVGVGVQRPGNGNPAREDTN